MQEQEIWSDDSTNSGFDFRDFFWRYLRLWPFLLLALIICLGFAWFYLRYQVIPQYHINAKVLIEDDNNKSGGSSSNGIAIDLGGLLGTKSSVDNEVAILKTRSLMEDLVRSLHLNVKWYAEGNLKDIEVFNAPYSLELLSPDSAIGAGEFTMWKSMEHEFTLAYQAPDTEKPAENRFHFGEPFDLPGIGKLMIREEGVSPLEERRFKVSISSIDNAVGALLGSLSSNLSSKLTTIIDLQLDYPLRDKGEYILGRLIDTYIQRNIRDKSRIADSTIKFIDERIILVNQELNGIEGNIQHFMESKGLANLSAQSQLLLQNSSEYIRQLADIESRIEVFDAVEAMLKKPESKSVISGNILNDGQMDQGFNSLITSYNALILERERLLLSYTSDNPYVINADSRIQSIKDNIFEYLKNTKNSLEISRKELQRNSGQLRGNIRQVPAQERAFLDLSRQQQLKQELYLFLLQKREETAIANTSNIAGIRVIDVPKADKAPFSPKSNLVWLTSFLAALLIPATYLYGKDLLNTKVRHRKDLERLTQVPVLAELNHNIVQEDFITFSDSRSPLTEQFRALRTNLQFMLPGTGQSVLMVTSSIPGEGKSFTSLNLAQVMSLTGQKVLLLELDLRKPKLTKLSQAKGKSGVTDYIVRPELKLADIIGTVEGNDHLFFVPAGPIPPNPSELLMSERMQQLIAEAKANYDMLILDVPPIGAVADAQILSKHADAILYLVRAGKTPHGALEIPDKLVREGKLKNLGIVLNDVHEKDNAYYGYTYYSYGYYGNEEKPRKWWQRWRS